MKITSPAFVSGGIIPNDSTCDGKNENPPLLIVEAPEVAKSLVLIMDDIDAPGGVFTHWIVFDMPGDLKEIIVNSQPEGIPGENTFGQNRYGGPCPHGGTHRYYFRFFALDTKLGLSAGSARNEIEETMKGHVLDSGELMGTYTR